MHLRGVVCLLAAVVLTSNARAASWSQTTQAEFSAGGVVDATFTASPGDVQLAGSAGADWWNAAWSYRFSVVYDAGATARTDYPIDLEVDFP